MWHYLLLGMPILGLILFFMLSFEWALIGYLALVLLACLFYYKLMEPVEIKTLKD